MAKNKKQQEEESSDSGSWLNTYADMVTLLMTFFVLMFAISNVDAQKFALLAKGLSRDGITAEQFIEIQKEFEMQGQGEPDPDEIEYPSPDDDEATASSSLAETLAEHLEDLFNIINQYIERNGLSDSISLTHNGDHLMLVLTNDAWFDSGRADIKPDVLETAHVIARILRDTQMTDNPYEVVVEGHTDNVPQYSAQFRNNWALGFGRAYNFLDILVEESGLDPSNFNARSSGEWHPIADNETPEGRQKNRRVEVMISHLKQLTQSDDIYHSDNDEPDTPPENNRPDIGLRHYGGDFLFRRIAFSCET